jgi:hypothetical protein
MSMVARAQQPTADAPDLPLAGVLSTGRIRQSTGKGGVELTPRSEEDPATRASTVMSYLLSRATWTLVDCAALTRIGDTACEELGAF